MPLEILKAAIIRRSGTAGPLFQLNRSRLTRFHDAFNIGICEKDSVYASLNEAFSRNCAYGVVYVTADRKGLYTQLLAAKLTGKRIARLVYSQPDGEGTMCNVELVEITD